MARDRSQLTDNGKTGAYKTPKFKENIDGSVKLYFSFIDYNYVTYVTENYSTFRLEIAQQESIRVRAFSVGSRSKRPEIGRLANVVTAPLPVGSESATSSKSNSAPLLSSSWGHNSGCSGASERMEDLMELDFTRPNALPSLSSPLSSYTQSHSHSHSYSTATDTSSYVDMSPGQPPVSTTAPYVDMSGLNKVSS